MGGTKKMKPSVVPHILDCQPNRKRASSQPSITALNRVKRRLVQEAVASTSAQPLEVYTPTVECGCWEYTRIWKSS